MWVWGVKVWWGVNVWRGVNVWGAAEVWRGAEVRCPHPDCGRLLLLFRPRLSLLLLLLDL